jgi:uncharacterized damage-inducible protein DinB
MASIFEEIRTERAALLDAVKGHDAAVLTRAGVVGPWSVKDVLAHIAGWQDWMLRVYPLRLDTGDVPEDLRVTDENIDQWNHRFVVERAEYPFEKVLEDLNDSLRRLMIYLANLGASRLAAPNPWPGRSTSITEYLREHLVEHDREHRQQIERALRRTVRAAGT